MSTHAGWSLDQRNPEAIRAWLPIAAWFYRYYFRVQTSGWQQIPAEGPVLLVGSHNGGLAAPDMNMAIYAWFKHFGTDRLAYGLAHPYLWQYYPRVADFAAQLGAVRAHPKLAIAALRRGASVLVYPGGAQDLFRPYARRHQIELANRKGFIKLALREQVPIVPIISTGAHDTLVILAEFYEPLQQLLQTLNLDWPFGIDPLVFPIYLGLPWGISVGPLPNIPLPVSLQIQVCPPIEFDWSGREAVRDPDYVDQCYAQVQSTMQAALDTLVASISG
ncbi:MAG: lysophospholipid acyltransferase family protein [Cyanobacteria bacterium P01_H01_bin.121]